MWFFSPYLKDKKLANISSWSNKSTKKSTANKQQAIPKLFIIIIIIIIMTNYLS